MINMPMLLLRNVCTAGCLSELALKLWLSGWPEVRAEYKLQKSWEKMLSSLGIDPRFPRPQRGVLTTRRARPCDPTGRLMTSSVPWAFSQTYSLPWLLFLRLLFLNQSHLTSEQQILNISSKASQAGGDCICYPAQCTCYLPARPHVLS